MRHQSRNSAPVQESQNTDSLRRVLIQLCMTVGTTVSDAWPGCWTVGPMDWDLKLPKRCFAGGCSVTGSSPHSIFPWNELERVAWKLSQSDQKSERGFRNSIPRWYAPIRRNRMPCDLSSKPDATK
jgi:hypothetical protein